MSLISLTNVFHSLGARTLFSDPSFAIEPAERTALVGLNGAGKSTVLRIISGELDVEGIERLEETLIQSGSTVLFVSHDRRFVERVATRVVEMRQLIE